MLSCVSAIMGSRAHNDSFLESGDLQVGWGNGLLPREAVGFENFVSIPRSQGRTNFLSRPSQKLCWTCSKSLRKTSSGAFSGTLNGGTGQLYVFMGALFFKLLGWLPLQHLPSSASQHVPVCAVLQLERSGVVAMSALSCKPSEIALVQSSSRVRLS